MTQYQVGTAQAYRLVAAGDGPTLIVNRSAVNTLLIGNDAAVATSQQTNLSIIDPLGSRTVGGNLEIWAVAVGGVTVVDVQQDAISWSASPAQIAAQIAAAGIFVNTSSTQILSIPNTVSAAFTDSALTAVSFNQIGYEIRIVSQWNATAPTDDFNLAIQLDWFDTTTNTIVDTDVWFIGASKSTSAALVTIGSGPTKGNQLKVTIRNRDTLSTSTVSVTVLVNSRTYEKDEWFWQNGSAVTFSNYLNSSPTVPNSNLLTELSVNVNAASTNTYACGLHAGRISFEYYEQGNISPYGTVVYELDLIRSTHNLDSNFFFGPQGYVEVIAPRIPISFSIHNKGTGVSISNVVIIGLN